MLNHDQCNQSNYSVNQFLFILISYIYINFICYEINKPHNLYLYAT